MACQHGSGPWSEHRQYRQPTWGPVDHHVGDALAKARLSAGVQGHGMRRDNGCRRGHRPRLAAVGAQAHLLGKHKVRHRDAPGQDLGPLGLHVALELQAGCYLGVGLEALARPMQALP